MNPHSPLPEMAQDHINKRKLLDEIATALNRGDQERDAYDKLARSAKDSYKSQKIEIENQFEMITNMLRATQQQLLTQLEEKHKAQQNELNGKMAALVNFSKKFRQENEQLNTENATQIIDVHDRITKELKQLTSSKQQYKHKDIKVMLDTSSIMTSIQKIAYIEEKTEEEMEAQQHFNFHQENKNLYVKPELIALNTNSMNTKICVSWKLQPVRNPNSSLIFSEGAARRQTDTGDAKDVHDDDGDDDEEKEDEDELEDVAVENSRTRGNSVSMTDDQDTSNMVMNVHEICSIDIEWRYSDSVHEKEVEQMKDKLEYHNKYKWNILDVEYHKILAFNLNSSIFDHILNTTRYGIYYFRITLYNRNSKISSKEMKITTFKVQVRHIADEWNVERKQKQLRLGFFNRKVVTRDIPGKFRHIFGTLIVSKGVCVWTLKIKKVDPNRDKSSAMLGVINMNNRNNDNNLRNLNQCFAHIGIGYGLYTTNGDLYNTKQPRPFGNEIKEGDVVQIMVDYRGCTISFVVNNISWGIGFDRRHFPTGKMPNFGLAVALRGCDEIQLIDYVNEAQSLMAQQQRRRSSSGTLPIRRRKSAAASGERFQRLREDVDKEPAVGATPNDDDVGNNDQD